MSTMQRLTLIGLYNYDSTLFDGLTLPEEYDKSIFIDSLLMEHGEKCVLYSNPDFMKYSIGAWGRKWSMELERIAEALQAEYNPIYNYDRYEEWTETDKPDVTTTRTHNDTDTRTNDNTDTQTLDNSTTRTHDDTDTRTNNNTDTQTNRYDVVTEQNVDGNAEHQVSADNSSSYQPESKDITNAGKTTVANDGTITDAHTGTITDAHTGTITDANSGTITDAHTGTITDAHTGTITDREAGTRSDVEHDGHLYGNIGVTTSAAMVSEVVAQRYRYNLYGTAARIFANELLIGIY